MVKTQSDPAAAKRQYLEDVRAATADAPPEARRAAVEDVREWLDDWDGEAAPGDDGPDAQYRRLVALFGEPSDVAAGYGSATPSGERCLASPRTLKLCAGLVAAFGIAAALYLRSWASQEASADFAWQLRFTGGLFLFVFLTTAGVLWLQATRPHLRKTAGVITAAMVLIVFGATFYEVQAAASQVRTGDRWEKRSPFTSVSFEGDDAIVTRDGKEYRWVAVNGLTYDEVRAFAQKTHGDLWRKRVAEDLVPMLKAMGRPAGETVSLTLEDEGGDRFDVPAAPMTYENRQMVYRARRETDEGSDFARWSPFTSVTFGEGDDVVVTYEGQSYRWKAINGVTVSELLSFAKDRYDDRAEKRVAEDLVEVMCRMGHCPGDEVTLFLERDGEEVTVNDAAMTEENRTAVWRARND